MEPIQLILIFALVTISLVYLKLTRYRFGPLILLTAVLLVGLAAVYEPDATTVVANYLGVERGTDLLLYATVVFLCAALAIIYGRFRQLDERFTLVIRELTLLKEKMDRSDEEP